MADTYTGPSAAFGNDWFYGPNWSEGHIPLPGETADLFGTNGVSVLTYLPGPIDPASVAITGIAIDVSAANTNFSAQAATESPTYDLLAGQLGTAAAPVAITATADSGTRDEALISFTSLTGSLTVEAGQNLQVDADLDAFTTRGVTITGPILVGAGSYLGFGSATDAVYLTVPGAPLTIDGAAVVDGGMMSVYSSDFGGLGSVTLENGGVLDFVGEYLTGTAGNLPVVFGAGGGTFDLGEIPTHYTGEIFGFGAGDLIIASDVGFSGEPIVTSYANGVLTVSDSDDSAISETFNIAGEGGTANFVVQEDAGSIFTIEYQPCFAAGTRIATPRGEVAVERLAPNDQVTLAGGGTGDIVWVGHRRAQACQLVRVRAGALGPGVPQRDLWLTEDHALLVDGALVPAGLLVDGATITRDAAAPATVYHVELAAHAVLIAEGAPAESYLDTGNRAQFGNCALDYDPTRPGGEACAELVVAGVRLDRVRAGLGLRVFSA